jgi:hypothetical protein
MSERVTPFRIEVPDTPIIRHWNELAVGGHFAAFEQPGLFVDEVRSSFRLVR